MATAKPRAKKAPAAPQKPAAKTTSGPKLPSFGPIEKMAIKRSGGEKELAERYPDVKSAAALKKVADDRYFSLMSRRIFRAGLSHSVVDAKWPAFEEVFEGFEPGAVRAMSDEALEGLMGDARVIRHWGKIKATRENAAAMCTLIEEHGSFGGYLAEWPGTDIVGLWADLATRFKQMGGNSAPRFLRMAGKDTFVLSEDVLNALKQWGAYDGKGKGKAELRRVQDVFNGWAKATGKPLGQISMILARSVG
jgi:3-methyladenine DNA glycosylase Tag